MKLIDKAIDLQEQVGNSVYKILKANIVSLHLKPGDRISEQEVSKILSISRTPVREAIIQLAKEGLVYVLPQRGTFISRISLESVDNARFIRHCIEAEVIRIAAEIIDNKTIAALEDNIELQKQALNLERYDKMIDLDQEFHRTIFLVTNRVGTWDIIEDISTHYIMARVLSLIGHFSWDKAIQQHEKIIDALKEHNPEKAAEVVKNHLKNLRFDENLLKEKYPEYFV